MITLINPTSLILGLIAWILPIINITKYKKDNNENWITFLFISMCACSISIFIQIVGYMHLVNINDWTAIMDTIGYLSFIAATLLIITIILNAITLYLYRFRARK